MSLTLDAEERKILLSDARESIRARLEKRKPVYNWSQDSKRNSSLLKPCGAFVSLHTLEIRSLRGCIGRMTGTSPLFETVRIMAVEAAFGDPRFPPLKPDELSRIDIEISALSPMEKCEDPQSVEVGIHGLYIVHRGRSGVLLPQVPVEQGWNRQEYLDYICIKAGLPPLSYEAPGAELFTFTAVVFGEDEDQ